jgi:N-acetylmuramoyl-L-alanine amidase
MSAFAIHQAPLPYVKLLVTRALEEIDLAVVHCTELPDLESAREYGERVQYPESGTGNCGHFYIDRDGRVEQWAPLECVAHHAREYNQRSVGFELVNLGRYPDWFDSRNQIMAEAYPAEQITALIGLILGLCRELGALEWICGHQDIDSGEVAASNDPRIKVRRKLDPGERFPWARVLAALPLHRLKP